MNVIQTILRGSKKYNRRFNAPIAEHFVTALTNLIESPITSDEANSQNQANPNLGKLMEHFSKKNEGEENWMVVLPSDDDPTGLKCTVKIESFEVIKFLSRLFYGIRCIHAHGDTDPTIKGRTGALNMELPTSLNGSLIVAGPGTSDEVAGYLDVLLNKAKAQGKQITPDYFMYENSYNFYTYFARLLGRVCACVVYYKLRQGKKQIKRVVEKGIAFGLSIEVMEDAIKTSADGLPLFKDDIARLSL